MPKHVSIGSDGPLKIDVAAPNDSASINSTGYMSLPFQPRCRATKTVIQSIPHNTTTDITLPTEDYDVGGMHDLVTNTDRVTIPTGGDGVYILTAGCQWNANSTGERAFKFTINGVTENTGDASRHAPTSSGPTRQSISRQASLVAGDIVRVAGNQNSGGALDINHVHLEVCKIT